MSPLNKYYVNIVHYCDTIFVNPNFLYATHTMQTAYINITDYTVQFKI